MSSKHLISNYTPTSNAKIINEVSTLYRDFGNHRQVGVFLGQDGGVNYIVFVVSNGQRFKEFRLSAQIQVTDDSGITDEAGFAETLGRGPGTIERPFAFRLSPKVNIENISVKYDSQGDPLVEDLQQLLIKWLLSQLKGGASLKPFQKHLRNKV